LDDFGREAVAAIADLSHHRCLPAEVTERQAQRRRDNARAQHQAPDRTIE
jgi:hypothetical protein